MILDILNQREKRGPTALKVRSAGLDDVMADIARVHIDHRPFSRAGGVLVIQQGKSRAKIRLVARGLSRGMKKGEIAMDSASRQRLQIQQGETYEFTFEQAGWWDGLVWAWRATDAMPRIASRLGVLSVLLGIAGILLGALSLYLAWPSIAQSTAIPIATPAGEASPLATPVADPPTEQEAPSPGASGGPALEQGAAQAH